MTDSTGNDGTKAVNCEINLLLTWSKNFIISNAAANRRKKLQ